MGERCLIVTGDDFGASRDVNRAIIEAHEQGILTSASLMVTGEAFEEAVTLAKSHPGLGVGLHLVISSGQAVLPPSRIPCLVDGTGRFSSKLWWAGLRYQLSFQARREIHLEIRAQLERFQGTGLGLCHVDGHEQMHMIPFVLKELMEFSGEFGIRAIRLPREELRVSLALDRSGLAQKVFYRSVFGLLGAYSQRRLRSVGIRFTEKVYGLLASGRMTEEYLLGLIPHIQGNSVEIYSHPTLSLERVGPQGASRVQLEALLSGRVREALRLSGFELATYAALP